MSKKETAAKKQEEYRSHLPDWYWKDGLHDAAILSASELELPPNWKDPNSPKNCLEIHIDGRHAIAAAGHSIRKISLYDYKIKTVKDADWDISKLSGWWMGDSLEQLSESSFLLGLEYLDLQSDLIAVEIEFRSAEVHRK